MAPVIVLFAIFAAKNKPKPAAPPPATLLDQYLKEAEGREAQESNQALPGAIWSPAARLDESGRDLRATQVDDVVTILVTENVNAVASGTSATERQSSANQSISNLAGVKSPAGALVNLLGTSGDQKLNGAGTTSRTSTLTATLTARVVHVLPGGLLLVEGEKNIQVNSEHQEITVRGVIRPYDLSTANTVLSTQVADMEIRVNGQGIVSDAVRRPNFLYRLLLGLLPF
ncbi:MAG TPA: flagellar basal body L-ring protein FlgH [Bryobacteraceae bacterium]|nr:flagellar basal body L-ring protein FlgH [Bryobacteraceae bacterium]